MKTRIRKASGWYWCIAIALLVMGGLAQAANESQKLTASDAVANARFGSSVSISGDFLVVGASGIQTAYVYRWSGRTWVEQATLTPNVDDLWGSSFGTSVSISGDRIIVGDNWANSKRGAAYVYQWDGTNWQEQAKLISSDYRPGDEFGTSVSISGDMAIVGVPYDGSVLNASGPGAAYVYQWNGSSWVEQTKLIASDGGWQDSFGYSVSLSGDRAIVGAWSDYDTVIVTGSAYVYQWTGSSWAETKLKASDAEYFARFGQSVSISGDRLMVGATGNASGSAYIYHWNGSAWIEQPKLKASDSSVSDVFGGAVAINGDRAIVGAFGTDDNGSDSGSAYVYQWSGSGWEEQDKLTASDAAAGDHFGSSVSISDYRAIVGGRNNDDSGSDSGSAYIYDAPPQLLGGATLTNATGTETIEWSPGFANVTDWWLYLGSHSGQLNYYNSSVLPSTTRSATVSGLPTDGSTIYAKLWYRLDADSAWYFIEKTYTAYGLKPTLTSHESDAQLAGATETFSWTGNGSGADEYWLEIGSSVGAKDYLNSGNLAAATSIDVTGLPNNGTSTVYVRLWYRVSGGPWLFIDDTFTAGSGSASTPTIISPVANGPLSNPSGMETIEWSTVGSGTQYWLFAGSEQGGKQYYGSGNLGDTMSTSVTGLPTNGSEVWIRLWYRVGGVGSWQYIDEVFTAAGNGPSIESSSGNNQLTSTNDTFSWSDPDGTVTAWWLYVGSSEGDSDYEDSGNLNTATVYTTVDGKLPTGGEPVYVRLWYKQGSGVWKYIDRVFTSAP